MLEFFKLLSNREISIIIWTLIIFTFLIIKAKGSFGKLMSVIKALFSKKFIPFYITFGVYFSIIISLLNKYAIWEFSLYKDFTYWFLTTGIVLFFNSNNLKTYKDFATVILTALSLTIIIEFIIGFYNFSLVGELILIPIVSFISLLSVVAELKKEDPNTKIIAELLKGILTITGFAILIYSIYKLTTNYSEFFTLSNLKSILLPPIFTLLFVPLIYFTVLYIKYETAFMNLSRYKFIADSRKYKIRMSILKYANINFNYIENANQIILLKKRELQNETNIKSYLRKNVKLKQRA
ncbi:MULTISPECIES: hypothetical protein [Aequorivita]|uniref:Uncharacterized protein n=1 Tax=Aequorivita iocasae TaxID=2803865 RepID=A0ABX7DQP4_9FLAO|nr:MULTISPECIES: hypothetical protein [Aequorivita]QQX76460.1 hypothetical protein JK629_14220 [Aequorivita iocasae]UCA55932.1 hypothetical protein LDL78_14290 [Aequorivita sp. F7]